MNKVYSALGPEGFGSYEVDWNGPQPTFIKTDRPPKGLLIPGFVDIHIHGAFGIDFMSASKEEMGLLSDKLSDLGYEAYLPTTITFAADDVKRALSNLPQHPLVAGFHLEGPFISPEYPGAQPPSAISLPPVGESEWDEVLDDPRLKVVTLAPELPNALPLISRLMQRGLVVSMGHTNATFDQARAGFEFGASHTTHTFNAMRGLHHREAGTVGYALTNDAVACELIYDRHHVVADAARLLLKSKPSEKVIAVSDSSMATGMPPNQEITMWGHRCTVGKGEVRLMSNGALAGSAISLLDAFRNLYEDFGPETAIRACCINPRIPLGLQTPRVWIELDRDLQITARFEQS